ncbi:MAG TPA: hypothetical protein VF070_36925 [Streptosporangiaceae bacterium]
MSHQKYYAAGHAAPSIRVPDYVPGFSEALASRLVGILHGCLKTRTCYDESTAWGHRRNILQPDAAASHPNSWDVMGILFDLQEFTVSTQ